MIKFEMSETIKRSLEEVFAFVVNPENEPKWHPGIIATERITDGAIGLGSKWRETFNGMGVKGEVILEITEYEPNQKVVFRGTQVGPVEPIFTLAFEEVKNGTKVSYIVEPKVKGEVPRLIVPLIASRGKRELKKYLTKLKDTLE